MLCVLIVVVVVVVFADTPFCHKENDVMSVFDKTISVTEDRFGEHVVVGLRLGGAAQDVTEANKEDVDPVVVHRIARRIAEQFHAFMEEVGDVLPLDLLRVFDEHELELLIEGMTEIDMDDRTRFTDYGGSKKTDRVIEWFWACIRSWPAERKLRLLQFTAGTSHVPVNGFKDLQRQRRPAPARSRRAAPLRQHRTTFPNRTLNDDSLTTEPPSTSAHCTGYPDSRHLTGYFIPALNFVP